MLTVKRLLTTGAIVVTAATLAACGSTGGKQATIATTASTLPGENPNSTPPDSFPDEGVTQTTQPAAPAVARIGQVAELSEADTGKAVAQVTITKVTAIRGEEYNKPERGYFLGVYVKVKALANDQSSYWGDFYVVMRGHHYNGDAYADRFKPALDYADLNTGETAEGWLVFDVPATHGQVILDDPLGNNGKLASWSF